MGFESAKASKPAPPKPRSRMGITVLYPPPPPNGTQTLDIIALHGLNGDPFKTFTTENGSTLWLRDMLPQKLPNARIMTFGYQASVFGNLSTAGVRDVARKLLGDIRDVREDDDAEGRPIVFIGHSLGGIIIKQALRIATTESIFSDIASCTKGIVFFGTPHRGADSAKWMSLISGIAATAFGKPKSAFVDTLKTNSEALMNISEDFKSTAEKFAIVSFYEEDAYPVLGGVIVEKYSAIMELVHEEAMMMSGNHQTMCRFTEDDERFNAVWRSIRRAAKGPTK